MRRLLLPTIALALIAFVAACSSESNDSAQSPEATETTETTEATEATGEVSLPAALDATIARGAATMEVLVLTALGDLEAAVEGIGVIDFTTGSAEVAWSDEFGDVIERKTADGLFAQLDPPDGSWFQFNSQNATPTSFALAPLTGLDSVSDISNEGPDRVDGIETVRLVGTTQADDCLSGAGFSPEDELEFGDDVVCAVSVWVDEEGLIVRIDRTFSATTSAGAEARSVRSTTFTDFGSIVTITTPTDVMQAPEGQ
jgi:hypothetical protein